MALVMIVSTLMSGSVTPSWAFRRQITTTGVARAAADSTRLALERRISNVGTLWKPRPWRMWATPASGRSSDHRNGTRHAHQSARRWRSDSVTPERYAYMLDSPYVCIE